ncbi:probable serine/threonine-protein kinase PBL19 isoform X1 [Prosopis cineraria]|uniref:probable serine/threonine-protein kinase PBL19 isoform X1 n=1 Tax=Prosopis cineraria TaxID=364024 RepID=UPI00240F543A|nr:probable serine/threonine-protein kinase PBL19 isoform X1 [Prosopis cineraria]
MYCFHYFTRRGRRRSSEPDLKGELKSQNSEVNRVTKSSAASTSSRGIPELYEEKAHNLRVFSFAELRQATNNFSRVLKIGEGGFGSVYKGEIHAHGGNKKEFISVAIKRLDPGAFQGHKQWLAEVQFLGIVEHPNLVKLIGYCAVDAERGIQRLLVYEYMPNKSLEYHLFNKVFDALPWKTRLEIALGAAQGLAYLHEELEVQVIYRDFKTSNVLLDENFRPKLSDFGLARQGPMAGHTHVSTAVMGTYGYAAPDYIETGHLTTKSDVWSFGVVLYEILTGRQSLDRNRPKAEQKLLEWVKRHPVNSKSFSLIIDPRLEGNYSINRARDIAKLADDCLSKSAKERPRMSEVVERLKQIIIDSDEDNPDEKNIKLFENDELLDQEENPNQPNPSKLWQRRMAHLAKLGEHVDTAIGRRFMVLQSTKAGS